MSDLLHELYKNYHPENETDKDRLIAFTHAIIGGLRLHPVYSKEELDIKYLVYMLTDKNKFFKFYNEIIENYPFNTKSLLDSKIRTIINCVAYNSLSDDILGATSFYENALILRNYLKEDISLKTNAFFMDFSKSKEENLATFISILSKQENEHDMITNKAIEMVDSIISLLLDYGENEKTKDAMLFLCDYDLYIKEYHKALELYFANSENKKLLESYNGRKNSISEKTISKMANFLTLCNFDGKGDYKYIFDAVSKKVINTLLSEK